VANINLEPGRRTSTVIELAYDEAYLIFNVVPTNATIKVGGEPVTSPDHAFPVAPNRFYDIRVTAEGAGRAALAQPAPDPTHLPGV